MIIAFLVHKIQNFLQFLPLLYLILIYMLQKIGIVIDIM